MKKFHYEDSQPEWYGGIKPLICYNVNTVNRTAMVVSSLQICYNGVASQSFRNSLYSHTLHHRVQQKFRRRTTY